MTASSQSPFQRRFLDFVFFKTYADLRSESSRTYIGVLWWILDPVIYMAVFYVVFDKLLQRGGPGFIQFLLVGLVFFRWFSNAVSNGSMSIKQGNMLMQQVYLPKMVFPLVSFVTDSFKFSFTLLLLLVFLWLLGIPPTEHYAALVPLLAAQVTLILGCLFLTSAVTPLLPDFRFLVNHGLMLMLFLSGIFYYPERLPVEIQPYFYLNPMACLLTGYRTVLIEQAWPNWWQLLYVGGVGMALLIPGYWMIRALDTRYPKIVRTRGG